MKLLSRPMKLLRMQPGSFTRASHDRYVISCNLRMHSRQLDKRTQKCARYIQYRVAIDTSLTCDFIEFYI